MYAAYINLNRISTLRRTSPWSTSLTIHLSLSSSLGPIIARASAIPARQPGFAVITQPFDRAKREKVRLLCHYRKKVEDPLCIACIRVKVYVSVCMSPRAVCRKRERRERAEAAGADYALHPCAQREEKKRRCMRSLRDCG